MKANPCCPASATSEKTDEAALSGELKYARWDAFASPNPCKEKVKHAEGIGKRFSEILADNIGEANFTTEFGENTVREKG